MIRIKNINKFYGKKQVLTDLSFAIETDKKSVYGIVGPNGAGKTTIIKIIMGLLKFTSGSITVDSETNYDVWCKDNIVLVPSGERGLHYKNSVFDNIMFFSAMKGVPDYVTREKISEYAALLNFEEFLPRRVETLSMGQKKKTMILCGLCTDMKIIIMDEPSNGLDVDAQEEMKIVIEKLTKTLDKTIVISSHDLDFLSEMTDHYIFLFEGTCQKVLTEKHDAEYIRKEYMSIKESLER